MTGKDNKGIIRTPSVGFICGEQTWQATVSGLLLLENNTALLAISLTRRIALFIVPLGNRAIAT